MLIAKELNAFFTSVGYLEQWKKLINEEKKGKFFVFKRNERIECYGSIYFLRLKRLIDDEISRFGSEYQTVNK